VFSQSAKKELHFSDFDQRPLGKEMKMTREIDSAGSPLEEGDIPNNISYGFALHQLDAAIGEVMEKAWKDLEAEGLPPEMIEELVDERFKEAVEKLQAQLKLSSRDGKRIPSNKRPPGK
jgi:hypothetical protein